LLPVQQQNTASTATKTRIDLRIEGAPLSLRRASLVAIGTSVRIDFQRHRHVCVAQDPHDHPRVDFQIHQQRCAGLPRVVNRHVANIGLVASGSKTPVEGPWIDGRPALASAPCRAPWDVAVVSATAAPAAGAADPHCAMSPGRASWMPSPETEVNGCRRKAPPPPPPRAARICCERPDRLVGGEGGARRTLDGPGTRDL